jgi:hypothetical protein
MPRGSNSADLHRHAKRTLYVVTGFYVVVGFIIATVSAVGADRVGTFLGFLIVSGTIAVAVLLRAVLQMEESLLAVGAALDDLRKQVEQNARTTAVINDRLTPTASSSDGVSVLDLAAIGPGDPSVLTAATLDRRVFPRLVTTMDDEPPAQSDSATSGAMWRLHAPDETADDKQTRVSAPIVPAEEELGASPAAAAPKGNGQDGPSTKDLLKQWKGALQNGDLAGCRAIRAAIIDVAGVEAVVPLTAQIEELADRVERSLRKAFTMHVRGRDFGTAMALGERICHLLPERRVCAEVRELMPHLQRHFEISKESARPLTGAV